VRRACFLLGLIVMTGCPATPDQAASAGASSTSTGVETAGGASTDIATTDIATTDIATTDIATSGATTDMTGDPPCTDPAVCPPVCDTLLQDCPAGHKCAGVKPGLDAPYVGTACVPDNAGVGSEPGSICITGADGSDTCGPTSMCVQFGSGEGACVPFCVGEPAAPGCADAQLVCARTDRDWPVYGCVPTCDPLAYDCPDLDFGAKAMVCQPAAVGFGCVLRGDLDGRAPGEPCVNHRDCTAAALCAAPEAVPGCAGERGCCTQYCDLTLPGPCAPGQACAAYYEPGAAPPEHADVGVCAAP